MTASGLLVNPSIVDRPSVFSEGRAEQADQHQADAAIQARDGAPALEPARRCAAQTPCAGEVGMRWSTRGFGQKTQRPTRRQANTGRNVSITTQRAGDADRADRAEAPVEFSSAKLRHSRPRMTVAAEAEDRRCGAPPGHDHRVEPAGVVVQFLAVAADQQQRVVGAGADHQDRQDALALPVEGDDAVLGQEVDHQRGPPSASAALNSGKNHSTGLR